MLDLQTMKLFFAILAVGANLVVVGYAVIAVAARWSPAAAEARDRIHESLNGYELLFAAIAAGIATLGSLYLSEVAHLIPCTDCWYQRIAMYSIAIILGIAAYRHDPGIRVYVAPLAIIGFVISTYHYLIQWFPQLEGTTCASSVPCTSAWFRVFGFISIPYMAGSAFALVLAMLWIGRVNDTADEAGG